MTSHSSAVRLLIVDDSQVVRLGLRTLLSSELAISIVGEAGSVREAVQVAASTRPEVVLMDIRLPDGTGFDACRQILANCTDARVLFLTSVVDDKMVNEAVRAGGAGYVLKEIDGQALIRAVLDVAAGKSIIDPAVAARLLNLVRASGAPASPLNALSPQERRLLALVAEGKTNKEASLELGLSEKTVKNYLANVFDKLGVNRRSQAVALFVQRGDGA